MIIVDSHCHLDLVQKHYELDTIINEAAKNGVTYMQTIATSISNFDDIIKITEKYDKVFCSVGVHPNNIEEKLQVQDIISRCNRKKVIGIGETGLDYYFKKDECNKKLQIESYEKHISAGIQTKLPLIVHSRSAEEDTINIIKSHSMNQECKFLIHCFSSQSQSFAKNVLDLDGYISFSGIITFANAPYLREIVKYIPLSKILVETDSPYLAPEPHRGRKNVPAFTYYICDTIAKCKNIPLKEVADQTTANFFELFSKAKQSPAVEKYYISENNL